MDGFPELFYLRNCPGANLEAGFFQIRPEISETSRPHPAHGGPGWPIPALAALFLCHARTLHYKLTREGLAKLPIDNHRHSERSEESLIFSRLRSFTPFRMTNKPVLQEAQEALRGRETNRVSGSVIMAGSARPTVYWWHSLSRLCPTNQMPWHRRESLRHQCKELFGTVTHGPLPHP